MKKVITYGTYDLLHYGHIRLLERAKALGDYLIVGVTAEDFDKKRGKINVKQSLMERIAAVEATGLADEIIVEEYEGQKIDDIKRYGIDIFTVGTDWLGKFDYLGEYCEVIYLERTEGISSSEVRAESDKLRMGFIGDNSVLLKYKDECRLVNGFEVAGVYSVEKALEDELTRENIKLFNSREELFDSCDAVYIISHPTLHYRDIKLALENGKHVLCESPLVLSTQELDELISLAHSKNLILMEAIKTAYATAYNRLLLMIKSGKIGKVLSVDATCTSLMHSTEAESINYSLEWNSMCAWGPTAFLPILQILGTDYKNVSITSKMINSKERFDAFSKVDFTYGGAVATAKVGKGVKSDGTLIVSGTEGYIHVPAPWWKTDYFEIRYENQDNNRRYFYQLDGEGIRYELVAFSRAIEKNKSESYVEYKVTRAITEIVEAFHGGKGVLEIQ